MLIYSHTTPQKLIPIAISRDYLRENTDLCDLVDDPAFAVDIDTAINYNGAISGDPAKIETFLNGFILSGYALDAATIQYYVNTVQNNPIFVPYIRNINRNFSKDYNVFTDCLNSPCNYFRPVSPNIGTIADVGSKLNYTTQPTFNLTAIPAGFAMGLASLNKIPTSLQRSFGQLSQLTTSIFKNTMNIFNDDPQAVADQEDAIRSGSSYRSTSIADVYTADYRSYFDVSTAASDILGKISLDMGDCFRLYQYQHRYNPFDYRMNQQNANKSGAIKKVGKVYTSMGYNGVNNNSMGDYKQSGNDRALSPFPTEKQDTQLEGTLNGTTVKLYITVFGGYYDKDAKTLYRDDSDMYVSAKGAEYFANTQNGIGHRGSSYVFTPSLEQALINKVKGGFDYPANPVPPVVGKFNRGFATDKQTIYNYFQLAGNKVEPTQINQAIASGTLQARINFNGKTVILPVVDTKGPSTKTVDGTSYRVLDITADAIVNLFGLQLGPLKESAATIDTSILTNIQSYVSFTGVSKPLADVQFIIDGVFNPEQSTATTPATSRSGVGGYSNGKIPASALTSIGNGHKLYGNAANKYIEMVNAAKVDGITWGITDSYRSYEAQVDVARRKGLYKHGGLAAVPGTSNHGLGKAVDLQLSTAAFQWLKTNAVRFDYYNIPRERWHWEYRGS